MKTINLVIVLHLIVLSSGRHYDDDSPIMESYDDDWMNQIEPQGYQIPQAQKVFQLGDLKVKATGGTCPQNYPNVYYNGDYCCEHDEEKYYESQGELCDNSAIGFDSLCCKNNAYQRCSDPPCSDYEGQRTYDLEKTLVFGDKIDVWGTYMSSSIKFSVNILDAHGQYLLHVDFRPEYTTVMNSLLTYWGTEIRCPFPAFRDGKKFKVTVECSETHYKIYFNDEQLSATFPYRASLSLATVVSLEGGSNGFTWDKISLPQEPLPEDFDAALANLQGTIRHNTKGKTLEEVKRYLTGEDSLDVFQWQLLTYIKEQSHTLDLQDNTIWWIINSPRVMETILTSGDVQRNRWKEAVEIIAQIIREDENAKNGFKLNLAVAIGLTFSTNVHSMAIPENVIDGIARYHNYAKWADDGVLLEQFSSLNAWQMRYVVGSWAEDEELLWARANCLDNFRSADKIADVTHSMVAYKLYNDDGVSVHDPGYYYYKPVTLALIHEVGGVCGAISKFGAGMAQAFGIPALPVGQPGHCAYIWLKNGEKWTLGNDISGWSQSATHSGIQYTWRVNSPFFPMMNDAQNNEANYRLSEKMRIVSQHFSNLQDKFEILEDATTVCPQNYDLWTDMERAISQETLNRNVLEAALVDTLARYEEDKKQVKNIALEKKVTVSINQLGASTIVNGGSEWVAATSTAWVEINLDTPCSIHEVKIHWWGHSKSSDYDLLAEADGEFLVVRTEADEQVDGWFNGWSILEGWDMKTSKIKLLLRNGMLDPWSGKYYFGIRQMIITGVEHGNTIITSLSKPVSTNIGNGAVLVDGNFITKWVSSYGNSWIKIDLQALCILENVNFYWTTSVEGQQTVRYQIAQQTTAESTGKYDNIQLNGTASRVMIDLAGSESYSLNEVSILGATYTAKDVLKMKVSLSFESNSYIRDHLKDIVETFRCEIC